MPWIKRFKKCCFFLPFFPPTGGRNKRSSIIPEFCWRPPDVFSLTTRKGLPEREENPHPRAWIDTEWKRSWRKKRRGGGVTSKKTGAIERNGIRMLCTSRCLVCSENNSGNLPKQKRRGHYHWTPACTVCPRCAQKHKHTRLKSQQ